MIQSIPARLTAMSAVITVIAMLLLGGSLLWLMRSNMLQNIDKDLNQVTHTSAQQINAWAADKTRMTSALRNVVGNPEPVPFLLQAIKGGGLDNAFYVQADKKAVFPQTRPADYDGTTRDWYKQGAAAQGPAITPAYIDGVTGLLTISFVEAARNDKGELLAVVGSDVYLEGVAKLVAGIQPTAKSFAFLMDNNGLLLAHPDPAQVMKPMNSVYPSLSSERLQQLADTEAHFNLDIQGAPHMLFAEKIDGTPWTLAVGVDQQDAMSGLVSTMKVAATIFFIAIAAACLIMVIATRRMLHRLGVVRDALIDIAEGEGDLTRRLDSQGHDELSHIAQGFNRFADKISGVISQIREASSSVHTATQEIASGNQDMSERTERQAHALQTTASAMEELSTTVRQNADHAREASQLAEQAAEVASRGGSVVNEVVATMSGIDQSSRRIVDIIAVIDSIAFQTNILALNAAVEAARAGEQGRGFAVVASEVRALAQRSATAAKEIKDLIQESVAQVSTGSRLVNDAGETMQLVVNSVRQVAVIVTEISTATQEQSSGLTHISTAIAELDQGTQQNAALVEESAAASQSLHHQATQLAAIVGEFKVQATQQQPATYRPNIPPQRHPPKNTPKPQRAEIAELEAA